jgi:AraC family transcriptional regulator, arabinose operon regulatory protein
MAIAYMTTCFVIFDTSNVMSTQVPDHFLRWDRPERTDAGGEALPFGAAFLRHRGSVWTIHDYTPQHLMVLYLITSHGHYHDADGNTGDLRPGSLLLRFPGRMHSMDFPDSDDVAIATLGITHKSLDGLIETGAISPDEPIVDVGLRLSILSRFDQLIERMRVTPLVQMPMLAQDIQSFLVEMIVGARHEHSLPSGQNRIIQKACKLLQSDLHQRIGIPDVARELKVSYSWLRKAFGKHMGVSPGAYRIERRMEHAAQLLTRPDHPPKVVAAMLGFPDVYSFSRQFKRFNGYPPGEFQRNLTSNG